MNPTHGTASTQSAQFLTLDDIKKAEDEFRKFQANQWMLVTPSGAMYKGSPLELLQILLPHHPLLRGLYERIPFTERESQGEAPGASARTGEDSGGKKAEES